MSRAMSCASSSPPCHSCFASLAQSLVGCLTSAKRAKWPQLRNHQEARMLTAWRVAILAALALALPGEARAQAVCPENVIRIVVPFPPGGPTDVAARLLAEKLKDRFGQNVIVESKAGAGGATGTGYVAQQPGNGCTLLLAYDTHAVNPVLLQLPFDTLTAFKPVVMIGTIPNIIGAHPAQPYKTFAEMAAEAKKEPDRLAYATGGTGTVAHLSM